MSVRVRGSKVRKSGLTWCPSGILEGKERSQIVWEHSIYTIHHEKRMCEWQKCVQKGRGTHLGDCHLITAPQLPQPILTLPNFSSVVLRALGSESVVVVVRERVVDEGEGVSEPGQVGEGDGRGSGGSGSKERKEEEGNIPYPPG